ncbi:MAG: TMEM165/GDT1 family protein [Proteobacteria bacterium]|nr:TMEM165/GDT1 family protein [Pseudomonadota bacterium]
MIVASAIGVAAGALLSEFISEKILSYIAGVGFILIGSYTLYQAAAT